MKACLLTTVSRHPPMRLCIQKATFFLFYWNLVWTNQLNQNFSLTRVNLTIVGAMLTTAALFCQSLTNYLTPTYFTVSSGVETSFSRAQPDLVKSAGTKSQQFSFLETRITSLECDLLRNQTQLDSKQVAFESLISQLQHNAKGFEAMAVLVNHFSNVSSMVSLQVVFSQLKTYTFVMTFD